MGARGNSGVILSQIVRGAAEELATRPGELIDPVLVAAAFARAADAAYESVRNPAEGTMLTVVRAMAHSAAQHLARLSEDSRRLEPGYGQERQDEMLAEVLEVVTPAGEEAVQRTPGQLDVLAEAGVVDAGAHGLVLILAGYRRRAARRGDAAGRDPRSRRRRALSAPQHTDSRYRYCVNFVVLGDDLDGAEFEPPLRRDRRLRPRRRRRRDAAASTSTPTSPSRGPRRLRRPRHGLSRSTRPTCASRSPSASSRLAATGTHAASLAVVSGDGAAAALRRARARPSSTAARP